MPYSDFTLERVKKAFELTLSDQIDNFADTPDLQCSDKLTETLRENVPLALASNTEKSCSEMIITLKPTLQSPPLNIQPDHPQLRRILNRKLIK